MGTERSKNDRKNDHFANNRTLPKSLHGVSHAFPETRKKTTKNTTKNTVTFFFFQTNTVPPPAFNSLS